MYRLDKNCVLHDLPLGLEGHAFQEHQWDPKNLN